jgi:inhibitor of KinA sporulation pathway (predicted exonuclease)
MPEPDMFILSGHIYNPESLLRAWPSSRVINITFDDQDLDQISYNWVTKNIIQESRYEDLRTLVNLVHREWPRHLGTIKMEDVQWGDVRNMSFITRWLNNQTSKRFSSISTAMASQSNVLNISFSDIYSGKIITQLNDIIEFCGITISSARRDNATRLIQQYSAAQTSVPWSLGDDITSSP